MSGVFVKSIAVAGLQTVTIFLIGHRLSIRDFGLFGVISSACFVVQATADLGLTNAITFFVARQEMRGNVSWTIGVPAAGSALITILAAIAFPRVGVKDVALDLYVASGMLLFSRWAMAWNNAVLLGLERFGILNVGHVVGALAQVAVLSLCAFSSVGLTLTTAVWSFSVSSLLSMCISAPGVLRRVTAPSGELVGVRRVLTYGLNVWVSNLASNLVFRVSLFVVAKFAGLAESGQYNMATQIMERTWLLSQSLTTVLVPHFSKNGSDNRSGVALITLGTVGLTFVAGALIAGVGGFIVPAYVNSTYSSLWVLLWLLVPGMAAVSASRVLASWFMGRDKTKEVRDNTLLTFALMAAASTISAIYFGATGAAIATSVVYAVSALLLWRRVQLGLANA